jgi:hypothetical protein
MNGINRRLDFLENAIRDQGQPVEHGLSRLEILNRIYDSWLTGEPSGLPPPPPETAKHLNEMYDRILASHQEQSSRNGKV